MRQITRRTFVSSIAGTLANAAQPNKPLPNFLYILADDLGYGDLGCYGSPNIRTPNLDRMAANGIRLTSFYATAVCTPYRSALMTGCYPTRVGLGHRVLFPYSKTGISSSEITLPEILKRRGYATAIVGKWHLGHKPEFLPRKHGFDYHFGTPYSNDMGDVQYRTPEFKAPPLPLMRNEEVIEQNPDQALLTQRYTDETIRLLREYRSKPFFLYLPHNMPHLPLAASEAFRGKSKHGLFGDAVEELDWNVGRILDALKELGLEENTLVVFTSDNGPAQQSNANNGSAGPLRGRKNSTWEGGVRIPFIARWPGKIPAGSKAEGMASVMDILPTFANLAGTKPPADRKIDGVNVWPVLGQAKGKSPRDTLFYYVDDRLQAVRQGRWKLHVDRPNFNEPMPLLYDLETDIGESRNVAATNPQVVRRLQALAVQARADLGDAATGVVGRNVRPSGTSQ